MTHRFTLLIFLVFLSMFLLIGCSGEKTKTPQFSNKQELENVCAVAFHAYGAYGAQLPEDSNLMLIYVKDDFLAIYDQKSEEINKECRIWLENIHHFLGNNEVAGILIRQKNRDLFHASRDQDGKFYFRKI